MLQLPNIRVIDPLGYIDFIKVMKESLFVLTDSGGVQEETTYLGVPCLTYRDNTERPVTVEYGSNHLVGANPEALIATAREVLGKPRAVRRTPPLWDGHAAKRIVAAIIEFLRRRQPAAQYASIDAAKSS